VQLGVQAVELDVHLCEGQLVVIHDSTLERTTSGSGKVTQTTFSDLRQLDAGAGAQIPTLAEVMDLLPEHVGLNIELKGTGTADVLAGWLPSPGGRHVLVSSFDHEALGRFRTHRDDYPTAPLFGRWKRDALEVAISFASGYINLGKNLASAARLKAIEDAGLKALIYTVNDLDEARRLLAEGAWGLFTDYPDRINRECLSQS
jgi:glycerophosphoryl diester phosphodiesterase